MIVVCLKLSTTGDQDSRFAAVSAADQAALEVALQFGRALDEPVLALSAGQHEAEKALREALACGADRAVRIDMPSDSESRDVGAALAQAAGDAQAIVCGDHSLDRGSGSVPAYIAHHRQFAQALGLVTIDLAMPASGAVSAVRRLDGGRREALSVPMPCVLSVESSVASLRRASLRDALAARAAIIESSVPAIPQRHTMPGVITPFRPRARALPAPTGSDALDRVRQLADTDAAPARGETVHLAPHDAAALIVVTLRQWGYLT